MGRGGHYVLVMQGGGVGVVDRGMTVDVVVDTGMQTGIDAGNI